MTALWGGHFLYCNANVTGLITPPIPSFLLGFFATNALRPFGPIFLDRAYENKRAWDILSHLPATRRVKRLPSIRAVVVFSAVQQGMITRVVRPIGADRTARTVWFACPIPMAPTIVGGRAD